MIRSPYWAWLSLLAAIIIAAFIIAMIYFATERIRAIAIIAAAGGV